MVKIALYNADTKSMKVLIFGLVLLHWQVAAEVLKEPEILRDSGELRGVCGPLSQPCLKSDVSCDQLRLALEPILKWSKAQFPKCIEYRDSYLVSLSEILPRKIANVIEKSLASAGPNCWNASLVAAGLLPHYRFSTEAEFSAALNSPLCHMLSPGENRAAGDIVAIRRLSEGQVEEIHGYVWLSKALSYQKDGFPKVYRHEIKTTSDVEKKYAEPAYMERRGLETRSCNDLRSGQKVPDQCLYFSQSYRCLNLDRILETDLARAKDLENRYQEAEKAAVTKEQLRALANDLCLLPELKSRCQAKANSQTLFDFLAVRQKTLPIQSSFDRDESYVPEYSVKH